ncbi:MAG: hypothetical protein VCG02_02985 [Verrucomicrobiota bacterium]
MQQKEVWFWVALAALYFAFLVGLAALYHVGAGVSQNPVLPPTSYPANINNWSPVDTPLASSDGSTNSPVNAPVLRWQESHAQGLQWLAMGLSPIALFWPIGLVWSIARRKHRATLARLETERRARVHPSDPGG